MPTIYERKETKYWTKEQVGAGKLFVVQGWHEEEVGNPPVMKDVLEVVGSEKCVVLNWTRKEQLAEATKEIEQDKWAGHTVVAFHDPEVMMGTKKVGGIAFRAPKPGYAPGTPKPTAPPPVPLPRPRAAAPAPAPVPAPDPDDACAPVDDDVPF